MYDFILTSVIAVLACLFCIWLLRPLAMKIGFVDRPNARKTHHEAIPIIGGVCIFFGFTFALLHLHVSLMPYRSLLAGSALLVLLGVVDDFHDLSPKVRLMGQLIVALIMTSWGGLMVDHLGHVLFTGDVVLGLWALPFTVVLVIAYINAFNMIDGQDGLAGCVSLVQFVWLFIYANQLLLGSLQHLLVIMMMLLLVFLSFNMSFPWRRRASIFLGDSGSTFVAFLIAWMSVKIMHHPSHSVQPMAILWVVGLPFFDLCNVVIYRIRQKKSIFAPGRDHFHHVLQVAGFHQSLSTLLLAGLSALLGGIGFLLNYFQIADGISFLLFLIVMTVYLYVVAITRQPASQDVVETMAVSNESA